MKNTFVITAAVFSILYVTGCKEPKKITMDQLHAIEDSIPKIFPNARTIHTIQNDDCNDVKLIVCDPVFYTASPDQMHTTAIRTGSMVLHVLGAGTSVTSGTLILTKDTKDQEDPADGIKTDMKIDSLEKSANGK